MMKRTSTSDSTSKSTSNSSAVSNEDQTPRQKESKGTNNEPRNVTQPPYTAHSFILPASVTSSNAGTRNGLPGSTLLPAPLSAPSTHHHMHGAPLAIAPFHGIHHPMMVTAGGNQGQRQASLPALVVSAPRTAEAAPATSIMIPHRLKAPGEREKLRSGKWGPEEEDYAMLLVRLFEQGLLSDCENGTTLRAYLARRLHCAPMRISKKFAGRGIGKMVYTAKFLNPGAQVLRKLNETEAKFKKATYVGAADHCLLPPAIAHSLGSSATAAPRPATTHFIPVPQANTNSKIAPTVIGSSGLIVPVTAALQNVLQQQQQHMFALNPLQQHHLQLFLQQQISQQQAQQAQRLASTAVAKLTTSPIPSTAPKSSSPVAVVVPTTTTTTAATPTVPQTVPPQTTTTTTTTEPTSEPQDLLSGFDKVIKSPEAAASKLEQEDDVEDELPHSPPFTSRSFDDFHRFLGKDLTLLEEESEKQQQPSSALFVEESYRMLTMDPQPNDLVAFRNLAMATSTSNNSEIDTISGVLDAVSSETNLFLHHPYGSDFSANAAVVSDATDTNSSEDSDESDGGPVRKKFKTDSSSSSVYS